MKRLLSSCQSQLVTKITNIQAVHTEKYCTQYQAYIYLKRHLFKKTVYMGYIYNWTTRNNDRGRACQNTASYWRKYTVKTMLWVSDYLLKQP